MVRNMLIVMAVGIGLYTPAIAFSEGDAPQEESDVFVTKNPGILCHTEAQVRTIEARFGSSASIHDLIERVNGQDGPYACIQFYGEVFLQKSIAVDETTMRRYAIFHVQANMKTTWTPGYLLVYHNAPKA